jgi:hypothetical protein
MSFDWSSFIDESDDKGGVAVDEKLLPLLPDGAHVGEIKWAGYQQKPYAKSPKNEHGDVLTVKIVVPKYRPQWESIPCHFFGKVAALCAAAGVTAPSKTSPQWDETQLVGKSITIETLQAVSKLGNDYVRLERIKPAPKAADAGPAKAPPRAPAKPAAEFPQDDIPF